MNQSKKVLFRADAKPEIGVGDLMSLIHLSHYFEREGWQVYFMIRAYEAGIRLVRKYNVHNVHVLSESISVQDEVIEINKFVSDESIDLLFFEITENKLSDYNGLSPNVSKACVSFDGHILPDMKLVVNWDAAAYEYFKPEEYPNVRFLLGPEYVILPYNFDMNRIIKRKISNPPERLLVSMGGADEHDFTRQIVEKLQNQNIYLQTTIIIGPGYRYRDKLEKQLNRVNFRCELKENLPNMFEEYMACDVGIGAGGLTSSELVATRTPAFLIAIYKHQEARCKYFAEKGWASYLGNFTDWTKKKINLSDCISTSQSAFFLNTSLIVRECNEIIFNN